MSRNEGRAKMQARRRRAKPTRDTSSCHAPSCPPRPKGMASGEIEAERRTSLPFVRRNQTENRGKSI